MRFIYDKKPSAALPKMIFRAVDKRNWLRFSLAAIYLAAFAVIYPLSRLLVIAGEFGHSAAGFLGLESRKWH